MKKIIIILLSILAVIVIAQSCATYYFRSNYKEANSLLHETKNLETKPFLKAHLRNGDVCILRDSWIIDSIQQIVSGSGIRYDFNRSEVFQGRVNIPLDSVAIFETNTKLQNPESDRIRALAILAGLDAAVGVYCITNPKACYGSCPTFYLNENDNFHYADAEGFSSAISPSMEYHDIDALNTKWIEQDQFSVTMKNEALETHCVNDVKLLAYPLVSGERVYQSPANKFYLCDNRYPLSSAKADEGNITSLLERPDRNERFSLADEKNLNSKEEIFLNFDNVSMKDQLGLILNFRQTMMTTYFIYSAMGYMGDEVADIFTKIETSSHINDQLKGGIKKELGKIDIYLWNESTNDWVYQEGFHETGPIAINRQFLPLQNIPEGPGVKIKIVLNKGLWRLDYVSLTGIKRLVTPLELAPSSVLRKGKPDAAALQKLKSPGQHLISMPGNEYKLSFTMPSKNTNYELFLYSGGYYLEWMRKNWLKEKNLFKLLQMVEEPEAYLRDEAAAYKKYEATMEREFWNSRIDTKIFSYYGK